MKRILIDCKDHEGAKTTYLQGLPDGKTEYCFTCNNVFLANTIKNSPIAENEILAQKSSGYIYLITNLITDKKYVGQTTRTIAERWAQH